MNTWNGDITLHKCTTHPKAYKHLHPSQLALVSILRHRNSITFQDIKKYKDLIDTERRNGGTHIVRIRIPNMQLELYNQIIRKKYANSFVALALTRILNHIDTLPCYEQETYMQELVNEYCIYVNKKLKFPQLLTV